MAELDISSAVISTDQHKDFTINPVSTDGPTSDGKSRWTVEKWEIYNGYYETSPPVNQSVNAKSTWTIGKGFKADDEITFILDNISGWGMIPLMQY